MNIEQRNALVVEYIPVVKRIVRSLRIEANIKDDCIQAGNLSVIKQIDAWAAAHPAEDWDRSSHVMIEKSIRRDVLREKSRLESCGDVDLNSQLVEANRAETDEDWDEAFHPTSAILPTVNDDNVDIESELQRDVLLAEVKRLPPVPRRLMLGVLAGHTVSDMAEKLELSQSAADRLYQGTLKGLKGRLLPG